MSIQTLIVEAGVRYWEDGTVNGVEDSDGNLIPHRKGDLWCPVINLESGVLLDWPKGVSASVHYKVCDAGEYWLGDESGKKLHKWGGYYVPSKLLCVGDEGYGDYIILRIDDTGKIVGWKPQQPDIESWEDGE